MAHDIWRAKAAKILHIAERDVTPEQRAAIKKRYFGELYGMHSTTFDEALNTYMPETIPFAEVETRLLSMKENFDGKQETNAQGRSDTVDHV